MIDATAHALFGELVTRHRRFVLTTHMNPDGDAIGSQLGLARFLTSRGAEVRLVNHDPTPVTLRFLEDERHRAEHYDAETHGAVIEAAGLLVVLDNSAPDRLGRMERPLLAAAGRALCIDHHPTGGTPWAHNILDESACATAALVYELTGRLGWSPEPRAAEALYVGIATDTGFFRFNSTTPEAHAIAGRLLRSGVDPARAYREIHERNSEAYTRLLGRALADLRLDREGAVVSVRITLAMLEACHGHGVDTSEITTALLSMDGVKVALLFRELPGGRVKVSLRSKGSVDVHRLATEFGGGGHRNASGIVIQGELGGVLDAVTHRAAGLLAESTG